MSTTYCVPAKYMQDATGSSQAPRFLLQVQSRDVARGCAEPTSANIKPYRRSSAKLRGGPTGINLQHE
ncbi:hypothetical protein ALUC_11258A [Aspergillus luchuensis]|nr:hypothetical protein ALUC_11258A [Aspergillus luchuensis]